MFRHLPSREVFGDIQSHLFPAYFLTQAVSGGAALAGVLGRWGGAGGSVGGVGVAAAAAVINLLVLEPLTTKAMYERRRAPNSAAANKKFGALHGASSAVNLIGLIGMVVHVVAVAAVL